MGILMPGEASPGDSSRTLVRQGPTQLHQATRPNPGLGIMQQRAGPYNPGSARRTRMHPGGRGGEHLAE